VAMCPCSPVTAGRPYRSHPRPSNGPAHAAQTTDLISDQAPPGKRRGSVSVVTSWPARMMSTSDTVVLHPDRDDTPGWETVHHPSVRRRYLDRSPARTALSAAPRQSRRTRPVVGHARSACWMAHVRPGRQKARQNRPSLALHVVWVDRRSRPGKWLNLLAAVRRAAWREGSERSYVRHYYHVSHSCYGIFCERIDHTWTFLLYVYF
jgi:hypothetical protein